MAKFFGKFGFVKTVDKGYGVYETETIERDYFGDFQRNAFRNEGSEYVNDDLRFSCTISVLSDSYLTVNLSYLKYVVINGARWKVNDVETKFPRLTITTGGLYNG